MAAASSMGVARALQLALPVTLLAACQAGYVLKQGVRQLGLAHRQVSIDSPELEESAGGEALEKLRWVKEVMRFCKEELGLEPGDSYQTYVDTGGKPISYAVTASLPLALVPQEWVFPFAGRVPYKGYFEEGDARREAERLRSRGLEAAVGSVGAFSTLGWFRDPVLSTMLEGSLADLADHLIHETTHRTLYFPGSSSFNESLATHVAREGTTRFLAAHEALRALIPDYLARQDRAFQEEQILLRLRNDLEALYRSPHYGAGEDRSARLRRRKREIFQTASRARQLLNGGSDGAIPESNPFVLAVTRYHEFQPLLQELQETCGGQPSALIAYLKGLPAGGDPVPRIQEALSARVP